MRRRFLRRTDSPSTSCFRQSELKYLLSCAYLRLAPGALGTMRAGFWTKAVHWLSGGLADYNPGSANPSDVWADDYAYHCSPARSPGEKAVRGLFPVKNTRSDPVRIIFACFPCRSSGRERTRMAGIWFSSSERTAFLTRSLYSRWERSKSFPLKKFFQFFLELK